LLQNNNLLGISITEKIENAKEFFGHRWLAKELYAEASIDDAVDVE
jgi:hypothetical protein